MRMPETQDSSKAVEALRERLQTFQEEANHEDILWANQPGNDTAFMTQLAIEQDGCHIFHRRLPQGV